MANMSDFLEKQLASHIFGSGTYTKPTVLAVALCSGVPVDANTGANIPEIANAGAYARVTFNPSATNWKDPVAIDGIVNNLLAITFTQANADWGWVSGVAICDSATFGAGNMLVWGQLTTPKLIGNGDQFRFNATDLSIQFL
jgi:hypothetical protein